MGASKVAPQSKILQLGLRLGREVAAGLDAHAALAVGLQQQTGGGADGLTPRFALAVGGNLRIGPGRALAQIQLDFSASGVAGLDTSLGGVQVLAGYLLTLR